MEKFLLLIREDLVARSKMTKEEFDECINVMTKWVESLGQSSNLVGGEPLTNNGRYVGKNYVLSDGPFIEAKEAISGYIFIRAENLEQATSFAQLCPLVLRNQVVVEVRPVMLLDNESVR